jgi:SET domain-containing protein
VSKEIIREALDRDFTEVRESPIAGRGLFAKRPIHKGARIIEYKGERVGVLELLERDADVPSSYIMHLSDTIVIDGALNGNDARFINHGCEPNCEAYTFDEKVFMYAIRDIEQDEELTFDYKLQTAGSAVPLAERRDIYTCRCGAATCRGTMLADTED